MTRNACATGSRLIASELGTRTGRSVAARVLIVESFRVAGARCAGSTRLRRVVAGSYEREQTLVVIRACRAAGQVRAHPGNRSLGIRVRELELHEAIEVLEALLAAELGAGRAEDGAQAGIGRVIRHRRLLTHRSQALPGAHAACGGRRGGSCRERRASC